jgi:hypothetical protein
MEVQPNRIRIGNASLPGRSSESNRRLVNGDETGVYMGWVISPT